MLHRRRSRRPAFATGERWGLVAGAVLLQIAFTIDCVDGQLARYTRTVLQARRLAGLDLRPHQGVRRRSPAWRSARSRMGDRRVAARRARRWRCRPSATRSTSRTGRPAPGDRRDAAAAAGAAARRAAARAAAAPTAPPRRRRGRRAPRRPRPPADAARGLRAPGARLDRGAGAALGQADHRLPDRRALRRDLAHRRAVRRRARRSSCCSPGAASPPLYVLLGRMLRSLRDERRRDRRAGRDRGSALASTATTARSRARSGRARPRVPLPADRCCCSPALAAAARRDRRSRATAPRTARSRRVIAWAGAGRRRSRGARRATTGCAGRCRRCCARSSTAALLWIAALAGAAAEPGRVRAARARSPSATTTSSTGCATAA